MFTVVRLANTCQLGKGNMAKFRLVAHREMKLIYLISSLTLKIEFHKDNIFDLFFLIKFLSITNKIGGGFTE